jgi:serine endopeptidase inhibitor I10-like protein
MEKPKSSAGRPFFARFLEGQDYPKVKTDVKAGGATKPIFDQAYTMKYPSDDDETGGGEVS